MRGREKDGLRKEWPLNHESVNDNKAECPAEWVEEKSNERKGSEG